MSIESRVRTSLVLNLILAVTCVALGLRRGSRPSLPSPASIGPAETTNHAPSPTLGPRYTEIASASDRRRSMVDRLRARGVPHDVLGLVAHADREMEWEARFERCRGDANKLEALRLEKDMSQDAEMTATLGDKDFKQWDTNTMLSETMATAVETTAGEVEAIYVAKKTLDRCLLDAHRARMKGILDEAGENAVSAKAYAAFNEELNAVLGPVRYAKSQQRDDASAAANFRARLAKAKVNPTDSQFRELFEIEQRFNQARARLGQQHQEDPSTVNFAAQVKALNEARDQEYRRVLGRDVFTLLQKARDPAYSQMKKYETYWGLDAGKIDFVYDTMKQYDNAVLDYIATVRSKNEDLEAAKNKLRQTTAQTQQRLEKCLGEDSFDKLERNCIVQFYEPAAGR